MEKKYLYIKRKVYHRDSRKFDRAAGAWNMLSISERTSSRGHQYISGTSALLPSFENRSGPAFSSSPVGRCAYSGASSAGVSGGNT